MVIHHNFLDKLRSNIYRARGLKCLISALGILILTAVFCEVVGVGNYKVLAESSAGALLDVEMQDVSLEVSIPNNVASIAIDSSSTLKTADLDVYVTTSASRGYTLMMTANSSDLTRTTMLDGAYPTIPTLASGATDFAANHWGYMTSADSGFKSFDPSGVQVGYSDAAETEGKAETITFGAKANSLTPTGKYQLALTFTAVVNPKRESIYDVETMQDFNGINTDDKSLILESMTEGQPYTVKDSRDNQEYTITKLPDGNVWMTQNLRFTGTSLDPATTNIDTATTISYGDVASGNSLEEARIHDSGDTTTGVWYNYAAATAMTIIGSQNSTVAQYSLCPAGWRIPTSTEVTSIRSYGSQFNQVTGGYYNNSNITTPTFGFWWTATSTNTTNRSGLNGNGGNNMSIANYSRGAGLYIRCILDNTI